MKTKPKKIGTEAESAVVNACKRAGFANAVRIALTGALDTGDVLVEPGFMLQVKGGTMARTASDNQIIAWYDEMRQQQAHGGYARAYLVVHRQGKGLARAEEWWVPEVRDLDGKRYIVRYSLGHVLAMHLVYTPSMGGQS